MFQIPFNMTIKKKTNKQIINLLLFYFFSFSYALSLNLLNFFANTSIQTGRKGSETFRVKVGSVRIQTRRVLDMLHKRRLF